MPLATCCERFHTTKSSQGEQKPSHENQACIRTNSEKNYLFTSLSDFFIRHAKGWNILVAFVVMAFCEAFLLPRMSATLNAAAPSVGPFDLRLFYSPEQAQSMLAAYGEQARHAYMVGELTLDILFPIAYTLFLAFSISWLFQRSFKKDSSAQLLNLVPIGAWLFDLLENISIVIMLAMFPSFSILVAMLSSFFTAIKWGFAFFGIALLIFGVVAYIVKRIRA
jgi:hypothetical protein